MCVFVRAVCVCGGGGCVGVCVLLVVVVLPPRQRVSNSTPSLTADSVSKSQIQPTTQLLCCCLDTEGETAKGMLPVWRIGFPGV